jgi:hypothetical protein
MSRVHTAMRHLEQPTAPESRTAAPSTSNLVGALIEELADEVPDDIYLESVRTDLLAAGRTYESAKKKDLALRFYLTIRTLLREHSLLQERMKKAEAKRSAALEPESADAAAAGMASPHTEQAGS